MELLWTVPLAAPVVAMAVEDFRRRSIRLPWFAALGVGVAVAAVHRCGLRGCASNLLLNAGLLCYLAAAMTLYVRLRAGKWVNPLGKYVGAGDVLFFALLTPLFGLREYLTMLLVCAALSLLWWAAGRLVASSSAAIPFVGTSSAVVLAFTALS